jgi:hypothetical protein
MAEKCDETRHAFQAQTFERQAEQIDSEGMQLVQPTVAFCYLVSTEGQEIVVT